VATELPVIVVQLDNLDKPMEQVEEVEQEAEAEVVAAELGV
jgi:hypothetical protein